MPGLNLTGLSRASSRRPSARRRKAGAREGGVVLPVRALVALCVACMVFVLLAVLAVLLWVVSLSWRHQQLATTLAHSNAAAAAAAAGAGSGLSAGAAVGDGGGGGRAMDKEMNPADPMHHHAAPPASPPPPTKSVRRRRKAKPTDLINQQRWQQFYRNIVLIVNYKRPQQMAVTLDLLHSLYGAFFQRILAVSEHGDADLGVMESPVKETGQGHDLPPGSLHYSVLPKLLTWHPMAEGFLWMDDDTVLNYWSMSRDNKSRIWFLGPMHKSWRVASLDPKGGVAGGWGGEGGEGGERGEEAAVKYMEDASERIEESGEALQLLKQAVAQALSHLPPAHLQQYQQSIAPKSNIFLRAASDIFYIPQRHAPAMRVLVPIFADHRIVADVAIPMMLHALEHPREWDGHALTDVIYLTGTDVNTPAKFYSPRVTAMHPWGLSAHHHGSHIIKAMSQGDPLLESTIDGERVGNL
ncbi:hypothetical protein CLOP_g20203 [Closterium sp. NIES-67]|nr:hypothetical protein CLOP_g20203 [Closterium sp. NIES-67]